MQNQLKPESIQHWYLLYTNPRAEKKVEVELKHKGYEVFLPLHKTLRQWSDRKKLVEVPLFNSYLFVYTELEKHYYQILNVPGIVKFVNFEKKPAIVDPREIELIKLMLGNIKDLENISAGEPFEPGQEVEIIAGPLIGTKGKMIEHKGKNKILIELNSIQQSLAVTLPVEFLRRVKKE
ncbi:MAG: UpxY family transcription antiterminator [Bacteroidota bacterium]|nr:UpxY family transcription antiterminator [Bacteroidota bacterium]